jgi:hypothetical protein
MNSSIRSAGADQGIPNRRVTWALTCEPSPSTNRPPLNPWRSYATVATVIGLRANATVTAVPMVRLAEARAATMRGRKGSRPTSVDQTPA